MSLTKTQHQGSQGHLIDLLDREDWWRQLNEVISPANAMLSADSVHIPESSANDGEWGLGKFCRTHCRDQMDAERFASWWVKSGTPPTWDLIATCMMEGRPGLLIVEAKAHEGEIHRDGKAHPVDGEGDKPPELSDSLVKSLINHGYIGRCIHEARDGLRKFIPDIAIDRDRNYQLSNRIASAWKLADCGMPATLLYLGFLGDEGMSSQGEPLHNAEQWDRLVRSHLHDVGCDGLPESEIVQSNSCAVRFCIGCLPVTRQSVLGGAKSEKLKLW